MNKPIDVFYDDGKRWYDEDGEYHRIIPYIYKDWPLEYKILWKLTR